jgi:hypothetical protein
VELATARDEVPQIFPANLQYYNHPEEGTIEELSSLIMNFPPFYSNKYFLIKICICGRNLRFNASLSVCKFFFCIT